MSQEAAEPEIVTVEKPKAGSGAAPRNKCIFQLLKVDDSHASRTAGGCNAQDSKGTASKMR